MIIEPLLIDDTTPSPIMSPGSRTLMRPASPSTNAQRLELVSKSPKIFPRRLPLRSRPRVADAISCDVASATPGSGAGGKSGATEMAARRVSASGCAGIALADAAKSESGRATGRCEIAGAADVKGASGVGDWMLATVLVIAADLAGGRSEADSCGARAVEARPS